MGDCGVFGVSSKEYLYYANKNRKEWEDRGLEVVEKMVASVKNEYEAQDEERTQECSENRQEDAEI